MKPTGDIVKIDSLGRILIPKSVRNRMSLQENDPLEFFVEEDKLVLRKYRPGCVFCGECSDTIMFANKLVCKLCAEKIKKIIN